VKPNPASQKKQLLLVARCPKNPYHTDSKCFILLKYKQQIPDKRQLPHYKTKTHLITPVFNLISAKSYLWRISDMCMFWSCIFSPENEVGCLKNKHFHARL